GLTTAEVPLLVTELALHLAQLALPVRELATLLIQAVVLAAQVAPLVVRQAVAVELRFDSFHSRAQLRLLPPDLGLLLPQLSLLAAELALLAAQLALPPPELGLRAENLLDAPDRIAVAHHIAIAVEMEPGEVATRTAAGPLDGLPIERTERARHRVVAVMHDAVREVVVAIVTVGRIRVRVVAVARGAAATAATAATATTAARALCREGVSHVRRGGRGRARRSMAAARWLADGEETHRRQRVQTCRQPQAEREPAFGAGSIPIGREHSKPPTKGPYGRRTTRR